MPNTLPSKKFVSISQAADFLGVSIDTLRRWDKKGLIKSVRGKGNGRFFELQKLEQLKLSKPLTITEAAERLKVSSSTLRRIEEKGYIKSERDTNGRRVYSEETIKAFLDSDFFPKEKPLPAKINIPLQAVQQFIETGSLTGENKKAADIAVEETRKLLVENERQINELSTLLLLDKKKVSILSTFHRIIQSFVTLAFISVVLVVVVLMFFFLFFPEKTATFFGYNEISSPLSALPGETNPNLSNTRAVLGVNVSAPHTKKSMIASLLKPFSKVSLLVIKQINQDAYKKIVPHEKIGNINDVLTVDSEGRIVPVVGIHIPDSSYIKISDNGSNKDLSDYVQHEMVVANEKGEIAVTPKTETQSHEQTASTITTTPSLVDGSVTTLKIADGSVTAEKLAPDVAVLGDNTINGSKIIDGTIQGADLADSAVSDTKLAQLTASNKVAGSAVQLASGGGLVNNGGLSLLNTCNANEVLSWSGSAWACAASGSGTGDMTSVTAGDGLTGGATTGDATLAVNLTTSGTNGSTSSNSGLEVGSGGLSLLKGCNDGELLKWSDVGGWQCSTDAGGGGSGISVVQENDTTVTASASTLDLLGADFNVSEVPSGEANVAIDYANSGITRKGQNETISGNWTFSSATPIALSSTNSVISISNTGSLSITDGSNTLLSVADTGTTGDLSVTGTINGATISGGALSGGTVSGGTLTATAVNGVTTTNITTQGNSFNGALQLVQLDNSSKLPAVDASAVTGLTKSQVGLSNVENTALSTWAGGSSITTTGTLTSGATGAGFTLNFGTSTLSGNITGSNIDESTLAGLTTSNMASANISQFANNSSYITAVTTDTLTNKTIVAGNNTITGITASNLTAGDFSSVITSGTYSINVSGNAATADSATTATTVTNGVYTTGSYANPAWITSLAGSKITGNISGNAATATNAANATYATNAVHADYADVAGTATTSAGLTCTNCIGGTEIDESTLTLTKTMVGLSNVENTAISTWGGSSNITNVGTITSGTWNATEVAITKGGTGATTAQGAINAIAGLTTTGDLLFYNGTNTTRLARGSNGQCLTSNSTTIAWGSCAGGGASAWGAITGTLSDQADLQTALDGKISTSGSYADPAWITSLAGSKITGNISGNAATATRAATADLAAAATYADTAGVATSAADLQCANCIGGTEIDESTLAGLTTSNFTSANISQWTNNAGYITDGNTNWDNSYGFITASTSDTLTNKTIAAGNNTITGITATNLTAGDFSSAITSGTYSINVSGNASTVTNGVYTTGSYANPAWITSLAGSKITGNISGNAATATNATNATYATNAVHADYADVAGTATTSAGLTCTNCIGGTEIDESTLSLTKSQVGLSNVENTALSTWAGSGNITTAGTLTSGGTGAGFTLNFGTSTLSGNIGGSNIDESSLAGLTTSNFSSANISQWTNNSGYITDGNTNWDNSYGFITASTSDTLTNKTIAAGNNTITGLTTSNFSSANVSQWTNDAGYLTSESDTLASVTGRGATTTALVNLNGGLVSQGAVTGKALVSINETGDQNILAASASGTTVFQIARNGNLSASGTINGATFTGGSLSPIAVNGVTTANIIVNSGSYADPAWITSLAKSKVGLGNVEDTALSTWAGTSNITTVGTIASGTWNGTEIGVTKGGTGATSAQGAINAISGLTTTGDILYYNGTNATRLARGSNGQCLTSNTTTIVWGSCGAGAASWGTITGTLSDQADLQAALDGKVSTSGSYADPSWITALAGSKISGNISGNAATATNAANATYATNAVHADYADVAGTATTSANLSCTNCIGGTEIDESTLSLTKSMVGLGNVENTALSTWAGSSNITTTGTLTSGATGAGFTLNFGTSTLSGNITGSNIDESTLAGLTTSNFSSANISQWTNNSGYITASTSDTLTNKTIAAGNNTITGLGTSNFASANVSQWTNDAGYITNSTATIGTAGSTNFVGFSLLLGSSPTSAVLSVKGGVGSNAALIVDQRNNGNVIAASASGSTVFTVDGSGNLAASGTINGATLSGGIISGGSLSSTAVNGVTTANIIVNSGSYADPAWITSLAKSKVGLGNVENTALSTWAGSGNITTTGTLTSGGTGSGFTVALGSSIITGYLPFANGGSPLTIDTTTNKTLTPVNNTLDFLIGGNATTSAKFAVLGVATNTPSASMSAQNAAGTAVYLDSAGAIQTTRKNTLTVGGSTTGNIVLNSGSGSVSIAGTSTLGNGTWSITSGGTLAGATIAAGSNTISGLGTSNFSSANISQWTNNSGYITASTSDSLTNKTIAAGSNTISGLGTSNFSSANVSQWTNDANYITNGTAIIGTANSTNFVGSSLLLGSSPTSAVLSVKGGVGNNAALIVDQRNSGNVIAASASGTTVFTVDSSGNLTGGTFNGGSLSSTAVNGVTTANIVLTSGSYADPSWITSLAKSKVGLGNVENTALSTWAGSTNITTTGTLTSGGTGTGFTVNLGASTVSGYLAFANGGSKWAMDVTNKVLTPLNNTLDFVIGGTSTGSAKFAVLGVATNTPSASVSAQNAGGTAIYLDATGVIQSVRNNSLTLGGATTGNIAISPNNGGAGSLLTINSLLTTFNGTTTITASSLATLTSASTLGISATTLNLGGGSSATIGTVSNDDLTLTPNGSGNIILTSTYQSGVRIGSSANTPAPLSVAGGIGSNAALIVSNTNNGDLFSASASATTKFTISNAGIITIAGNDSTADIKTQGTNSLKIDTGGAAALGIGTVNTNAITIGKSGTTTTIAGGLTVTAGQTITLNNDAFTDFTGSGLSVSSNALTINLTSSGNTGSTSSNSGLEVGSSGLTLLKGCSDSQTLKYTDAGGWACADDNAAAGGPNLIGQYNGLTTIGNTTTDFAIGGTSTGSAKFVFMNMDPNSGLTPLASFSGNLLLEAKPNSTATQQTTWTAVSSSPGTIDSGGTSLIASISASAIYNGSVYVGTYKDGVGSAEVYRYDGPAGNWTKVSQTTAGTLANGGTTNIGSVSAMTVFDGYLYAGTSKMNAAEVYRYDGGTNWTKVSAITAGTIKTGGTANIDGVASMTVFQGRIYLGTREGGAAQLYRYDGGTSWSLLNATAGTFVTTNTATVNAISSMAVLNGVLYFGTQKTGDADVVRYQGGGNGGTAGAFLAMNAAGTTGSYNLDGTAVTGFDDVPAMTVYNGSLIVGLRKNNGAEVYQMAGSIAGETPINTWTRLNNAAGQMSNGGTSSIDAVTAMTVYNGILFIGTNEPNNAEVYRYTGGDQKFFKVSQSAAGTIQNGGRAGIDQITTLQPTGEDLYAGTLESGAAEVYKYTASIDRSYALKFHAAPEIAGGEQSGNLNEASIFYMASASANLGSTAGNTGAFIFSHGIQTRNGSYDVAEDYPTRDDSLEPGDMVTIDTNERGFVKKAEGRGGAVMGVYSEKPALRLTQQDAIIDGARAIPIALAGRVPVKVSTENGEIKPGDSLMASSIPGVAMKATKAGQIIGQAMAGFTCDTGVNNDDSACIGKVLTYVATGYFTGEKFASQDGLSTSADGKAILAKLMSGAASLGTSDDFSELVTDRVVAGLEIVTPKVIADEVIARTIKADNIEGLEFLVNGILDNKAKNVANGSEAISSNNDIATPSATARNDEESNDFEQLLARTAQLDEMTVKTATVSGDLRVQKNALVEGVLNVVDTLTANTIIVSKLADFFGTVIFHGDVSFQSRPTFNNDTAGVAVIKKGDDKVEVKFEKSYEEAPVVSANIVIDQLTKAPDQSDDDQVKAQSDLEHKMFENGIHYLITRRTKKGFVILLNKPLDEDTTFSWTAFSVAKDNR